MHLLLVYFSRFVVSSVLFRELINFLFQRHAAYVLSSLTMWSVLNKYIWFSDSEQTNSMEDEGHKKEMTKQNV